MKQMLRRTTSGVPERLRQVRQQWRNYRRLFSWLIRGYYQAERSAFWHVQLLMGMSTVAGFAWMTGVLLGFMQHVGALPERYAHLSYWFADGFWHWLLPLSLAGLLSAWAFYRSFQVGVDSALRYQKHLFQRALQAYAKSGCAFPMGTMQRVLKLNTHLAGQLVRRLVRSFIPALTAAFGSLALLVMNPGLTLALLPVMGLFAIALYRVNRQAANTASDLQAVTADSKRGLEQVLRKVRHDPACLDSCDTLAQLTGQSRFLDLSRLRYQRRLVETHIAWLKIVLLVLAIVLIAIVANWQASQGVFDWAGLLVYLVVLRYAATGWQSIGAASVAFSRFYPEILFLYQFLEEPVTAQASTSQLDEADALDELL